MHPWGRVGEGVTRGAQAGKGSVGQAGAAGTLSVRQTRQCPGDNGGRGKGEGTGGAVRTQSTVTPHTNSWSKRAGGAPNTYLKMTTALR